MPVSLCPVTLLSHPELLGWPCRRQSGRFEFFCKKTSQAGPEPPDALGETNLLALASRIADPYYIGFGSAAAHYGLTTQHRRVIFVVTSVRVRERQVGRSACASSILSPENFS